MGRGPYMQRDHQSRRPRLDAGRRGQSFGELSKHGEGSVAGGLQVRERLAGDAGFEHGGVVGGFLAGEREVGAADGFGGPGGISWRSGVKGGSKAVAELVEASGGDFRQQGFGVTEMAVRGRWADPGEAGGLGDREARRTFGANQVLGRLDQGLSEVAVVVAATGGSVVGGLGPAHVRGVYMRLGVETRKLYGDDLLYKILGVLDVAVPEGDKCRLVPGEPIRQEFLVTGG